MHNYKSIAPWRGCPDIMFGYYNDYADPDLLYKGWVFNYWDIEAALWENFTEEFPNSTDDAFSAYVRDAAPLYLEDCIANNYFPNGVKDWHDAYATKE